MFKTIAFLVLTVLLLPASVVPQHMEQTPTLETCVKNLNEWSFGLDGISFGEQARLVMRPLTSKEIIARVDRLTYCGQASLSQMSAVPIEQRHSLDRLGVLEGRIKNVIDDYIFENYTRHVNFIARHKLLAQFDQEDEAGER